jgi:aryl-alcohol dehydrogenase-like predicted oxidoreductase
MTSIFGNSQEALPRIGFGAMGITSFYASSLSNDEIEEAGIEAMVKYAEAVSPAKAHIDTALIYIASRLGGRHNEEVVGEAIRRIGRDRVFIATKGSMNPDFSPNSSDSGLRSQLESSLKRLGVSTVDLYYEHRRDLNTPIESVMATFKALKEEGKIRFCGLSECSPSELRAAHAVFPVTAIQMEYSLQSRSIEKELLNVAKELGVAVVAYSPLGRGFLSGTFSSRSELDPTDWRLSQPRFSESLMDANASKASALKSIAEKKKCTTAQLALAWLLHKGGDSIFPIPGTKSAARAIENANSVNIILSHEDLAEIEACVPEAEGDRYEGKWGQFETRL